MRDSDKASERPAGDGGGPMEAIGREVDEIIDVIDDKSSTTATDNARKAIEHGGQRVKRYTARVVISRTVDAAGKGLSFMQRLEGIATSKGELEKQLSAMPRKSGTDLTIALFYLL